MPTHPLRREEGVEENRCQQRSNLVSSFIHFSIDTIVFMKVEKRTNKFQIHLYCYNLKLFQNDIPTKCLHVSWTMQKCTTQNGLYMADGLEIMLGV